MKRVWVRSVQVGLVLGWCLVWPRLHDWLVREQWVWGAGWLIGLGVMLWIGEKWQRIKAPELNARDPERSPEDRDW